MYKEVVMSTAITQLISTFCFSHTVKFLNFWTPENFAVIYLKLEQRGQTLGYFYIKMQMEKQTVKTLIRVQTVKTLIRLLLKEQSDLGLHCLPRYLGSLIRYAKVGVFS